MAGNIKVHAMLALGTFPYAQHEELCMGNPARHHTKRFRLLSCGVLHANTTRRAVAPNPDWGALSMNVHRQHHTRGPPGTALISSMQPFAGKSYDRAAHRLCRVDRPASKAWPTDAARTPASGRCNSLSEEAWPLLPAYLHPAYGALTRPPSCR